MSQPPAPRLTVSLRHRVGSFAVDVDIRSGGGVTALFGPSGSGKTTIVNVIGGLMRPAEAQVAVDGLVLVDTTRGIDLPAHRRRIGYVFQEPRLFPHLTVRQNLRYGRFFAGRATHDDVSLDHVVALLGIAHLMDRLPRGLSGGEKQRVAIGRALLARPRLILMDEPLSSLDAARKAEILPLIERLRDEARIPIVYVSHALDEVTRLATDIVLLREGRVEAQGPTETVLAGHDVTGSGRAGPRTVLGGRVIAIDPAFHLATLDTPIGPIVVPAGRMVEGDTLRLVIPAQDVLVATGDTPVLSALNMVRGAIVDMSDAPEPAGCDVTIAAGAGRLVARITRRSRLQLGLVVGQTVTAIIKSVALGGRASA